MKKRLLLLLLPLLALCLPAQAQIQWKWTPVSIDSTFDDIRDLRATEIIAKYNPQVAPLQEILGYSEDEYRASRPESPLSNFAADVIKAIAEKKTGDKVDIALINFGGIRTSLPKGAVRVYDIFSIFPFDNYLVTFDIKGSDLRRFLEQRIERGRLECLSNVEIEIRDRKAEKLNVAGAPLDDERVYKFATINFLMDGGDGVVLSDVAFNRKDTGVWIRDAICEYLRDQTARGEKIVLSTDGRIKDYDYKDRRASRPAADQLKSTAQASTAEPFTPELVIVHTNDTHSQIEPIRVGYNKGLGGVERRLQYIDAVREKYGKRKVLLLDAGDFNQGTPYYTVAHGDLEVELVNMMGYDVMTLGNHEFDNGQEDLARRLKNCRHKVVTCNYDFSNTPLKKLVKPYVIVRRGGMKIGIIGTTSYLEGVVLKSHLDGMVRLNSIEEVNKWADYLKNRKHCDLVILLSHFGYDGGSLERPSDVIMVENSRNLDIVVGGHSHTYLKEARQVKDLDGRVVPITQCGGQGIVAGTWEITRVRP